MRLSIDHRTIYRFTEPQRRLVQMLRMTPQNSHDQTVASWRIDVDCDVKMRPARDGFGNAGTMLYVEGPVEHIEITVSGEVLTSENDGVLHGANELFPPALFLRATDATAADPAIVAFARDHAGAAPPLERLRRLNTALYDRFSVDQGRPEQGVNAATAFARDTATSRDLAHIFAVAARGFDVPARYVSGYTLIDGSHSPTPHGWAEAYVEGTGWIAFDPCTGRSPSGEYVRVATALDAIGAAAVAGSRLGQGEERLDVDVTVERA